MDLIKPGSKEYRNLSWIDQQLYDELNYKDFKDVVRNIEEKGTRPTKVILRLDEMQQLRRKIGKKNRIALDDFGDFVIDSSLVVGAKII